jgi:hypothetical protein
MIVGKDGLGGGCRGVGRVGGVFVKVVRCQWAVVSGGGLVFGGLVGAAGAVGPGGGGGDGVARAGGHGWLRSCEDENCSLHDWGVVAQQAVDEHQRRGREW